MISSKKLIKLARKWQRIAAASRKKISYWPKSEVADEGHFVIYTLDGKRYMIPLSYLSSEIVKELFRMSEEEFGVNSDRPITLPCDSTFMDYAISILQRQLTKDLEKALILTLDYNSCHCSSSSASSCLPLQQTICSF